MVVIIQFDELVKIGSLQVTVRGDISRETNGLNIRAMVSLGTLKVNEEIM